MPPKTADAGSATYPSLRGRKVIVTGGAAGIGGSIVEHFCRQGSAVAFLDIDRDASAALVSRLGEEKMAVAARACDVRDAVALGGAVRALAAEWGGVDVLVNNAGRDDRDCIDSLTPEGWDEMMAVNLRHCVFAAKAAAPFMRSAGRGAIVNLGSITWRLHDGGLAAYATAKAAIEGLTRTLARDLGRHSIRVNCVAPGWVMTERQLRQYVTADAEARIMDRQCLPYKLEPADVASMVLFLASDDARGCAGQTYIVDAGWA